MQPRGEEKFGWDPWFQPRGSNKTFAEMTPQEKDQIPIAVMRMQLAEHLKQESPVPLDGAIPWRTLQENRCRIHPYNLLEMTGLRRGAIGGALEIEWANAGESGGAVRKDALCGFMTVNNGSKRARTKTKSNDGQRLILKKCTCRNCRS